MLTALIDYDSGNLHSAQKAFERMATEVDADQVIVTSDPDTVASADRIVLPGDGAFPHCRAELFSRTALAQAIIEAVTIKARPFMGNLRGHADDGRDWARIRTNTRLWVDRWGYTANRPCRPDFEGAAYGMERSGDRQSTSCTGGGDNGRSRLFRAFLCDGCQRSGP